MPSTRKKSEPGASPRPRTARRRRPSRLLTQRQRHRALAQLQGLVLDCDGVLTPGDLYYDQNGVRMLRFNARDGWGIAALCRLGFPVAVLSGRPIDIAEQRFRELGVHPFVGRCHEKGEGLAAVCETLGILPTRCAFVGDDLPDLPAFARCGLAIAVADADPEVIARAHWVTSTAGGRGAVREVCTEILKVRGLWETLLRRLGGDVSPSP